MDSFGTHIDSTELGSTELGEPASSGMSRRQVLRAGAAVGAGLLWVAPVVSGLGLTAAHADSTSGTTSPPVSPPNSPPVSPPNSPPVSPPNSPPNSPPVSPPNSPPNSPPVSPPGGTQPVGFTDTPPTAVLGETFTNTPQGNTPQAGAVAPAAVLPFTGAAAPIKSATIIGAGLVATGAAAIIATNRRQEPAVASDAADGPAAPTGPKHAAT